MSPEENDAKDARLVIEAVPLAMKLRDLLLDMSSSDKRSSVLEVLIGAICFRCGAADSTHRCWCDYHTPTD